ncbi:MAG TPA: hypothetical protein VLT59_15090 [Steroidobacteraceae bacterium]|nr:hypothetical protein [Steroidobacteraceae bacterium]
MIRYRVPFLLVGGLLSVSALAQPASSEFDEIRRELAELAARVTQLESDNAELRQRNDALERVVQGQSVAAPTVDPATPPAMAADAPPPWYENFKVSGYLIGDAYAVADHHDPAIDGQNGFWIRRSYLTFDMQVADEWSARLRFEANSPGDFTTNSKLEPFVKDAYLRWTRGTSDLFLGLSPAPTFEFIEGFWGYRHLEKTPLDLYRLGSSRDIGVAFKGKAAQGRVFYHAMLGNGAGDGAETNEGKKIMGSVGLRPTESLVAELYADFEDRPGSADRTTWQAFVGWRGEGTRYGLQYALQERELDGGGNQDLAVASAFATWRLTARDTLIARYDRSFDGYPDADRIAYLAVAPDTPFDLAILGWERALDPKIRLIPNIEYVRYRSANGLPAPDDDMYARLTLYYTF